MREKPPPPPVDDIPAWFMTYSDVITLLMTFFILLLTFSTNEPEMFEKMQISLFGGGGASGTAGPPPEGADKDARVVRIRPKTSRYALHGTETPPILNEPPRQAVNKGIEVLDTDRFDPTTTHAIKLPINHLLSDQGEVASTGIGHVEGLSRALKRHDVQLTVEVSAEDNMTPVLALAKMMIDERAVKPNRIAVSLVPAQQLAKNEMRLVISHSERQ